jgi:hypothetical protein
MLVGYPRGTNQLPLKIFVQICIDLSLIAYVSPLIKEKPSLPAYYKSKWGNIQLILHDPRESIFSSFMGKGVQFLVPIK